MIEFGCRGCGRFFRVADQRAGMRATCPDCRATVTVPSVDEDLAFESFGCIDEKNNLQFDLYTYYQAILDVRDQLGVSKLGQAEGFNIISVSFQIEDSGRAQTVLITQGRANGPVICSTQIGRVDALTKIQIIDVLREFADDGILFRAHVDEHGVLGSRAFFSEPPRDVAQVLVKAQAMAAFADKVERAFFGIDAH